MRDNTTIHGAKHWLLSDLFVHIEFVLDNQKLAYCSSESTSHDQLH